MYRNDGSRNMGSGNVGEGWYARAGKKYRGPENQPHFLNVFNFFVC